MDAELITTGTELLLGEIVDTNAAWLARRLRDLGINLFYRTSVGDNLARITAVMRQGLARSDLVLVTGGLGPTVDDVTREAAARATDRELALDKACWADIQALFRRWGRSPGENNRRQAFLPVGAIPVLNPVGTAPGFIVEIPRPGRAPAMLVCLPGVPREMKHLMAERVEPFLVACLGPDRVFIKSRILRTVGIGESAIDAQVADLMRASNPTVGLAAHLGQVDVRITARASSEPEADSLIAGVAVEIRKRLGRVIYGEGDEPLEAVVVRRLQAAGWTLALLETNSGGEMARRLLAIAAGGQVVRTAYVVSSGEELPVSLPQELVSQEGADWIARWLLEDSLAGSPNGLALVVCGTLDEVAGPYGKVRGQTFVVLATSTGLHRRRFRVGGTGDLARRWTSNAALNELRLWLETGSDDGPTRS